jgi:hypothetical protein
MFGKQTRGYKMPNRMAGGIRCFQSAVNFLMEAICDFYRDFPKPWKFATVSNDLLFAFVLQFCPAC